MPRPVSQHRSASKEQYQKFCKLHPNTKISFEEYKKVIYKWNENYMTYILETGEKIKVPHGFGALSINKKKTTRYFEDSVTGKKHCILPVDWKKTKELGKKVYILNNHTDGYRCKWFWFKKEARIKMSEIWSFTPCRAHSDALCRYLTTKKDKQYIDIYNQWYSGRA